MPIKYIKSFAISEIEEKLKDLRFPKASVDTIMGIIEETVKDEYFRGYRNGKEEIN